MGEDQFSFSFDNHAANKLGDDNDIVNWISHDDVFAWQDFSFLFQNEKKRIQHWQFGMKGMNDYFVNWKLIILCT